MRNRNHPFTFYMNNRELAHFEQKVKLSGISKSEFLRQLIKNVDIKPKPPDEYIEIYKLLSNLVNNIDQISEHINSTGDIDPKQMDAAVILIRKCWEHIEEL